MTAPTLSAGFLGAYSGVEFVNSGAMSSEPVTGSSAESFNALLEMLTSTAEPVGPAGPTQAAPFNAVAMQGEDSAAPAAGNAMRRTDGDAPVVSARTAGEVQYPAAFAVFDAADFAGMLSRNEAAAIPKRSRPSTGSGESVDAGAEMGTALVSSANPPTIASPRSEDGNGAAADADSSAQLPENAPDAVPATPSAVPRTAPPPARNQTNGVQQDALVPSQPEVKRTTAADIGAPEGSVQGQNTLPADVIEGEAGPEADEEAEGEQPDIPPFVAGAIPQGVLEVSTPVRVHGGASFSERSMAASGQAHTDVKPNAPQTASGYGQPAPSEDHVAFSATLTDASQEASAERDVPRNGAAPRMADTVPAIVLTDATRTEGQTVAAPHRSAAAPPVPTPAAMEPLELPEQGSAAPRAAHDLRVAVETGDRSPSRLEIRVSDRGGKIDVAVHSADPNTRNAVRSDLNELVGRLERAGYGTEMHQPAQGGSFRDATSAVDRNFTANETAGERNAQAWDPAARDTQGTSDLDHGRREREEPPPRRFPQARPQSPGRSFIDEFKR